MILESSTHSKVPMVYLSPTDVIGLTKESNIVLSPHFYWCKKSSIPFSSLAQAKKIAPSLFENDTFSTKLSFEVYKNANNELIFLAYDIKEITKKLQEMGIDFKLIKNIYLAQQLCESMTWPLETDEHHALVLVDGIVATLSQKYLDEPAKNLQLFLNSQEVRAKKIPIEGTGNFDIVMYKNQLIALASLFALIIVLQFVSLHRTQTALDEKETLIRTQLKLPATQMQMTSIAKRLSKKEKEQLAIRESLYFISKNRATISGRLKQLTITPKNLDLEFSNPDPKLQSLLKQNFSSGKQSLGEDILIVKVDL